MPPKVKKKTEGFEDVKINVGASEKKTDAYLVAIDVGFGMLKYISNAKPDWNVIPSAGLRGYVSSSNLYSEETINEKKLVVSTKDGTWFIGENALYMPSNNESPRTKERDRANDPLSRTLFHTGIALAVPDEEGEYDVHIVTGLPNEDYDLFFKDNLQKFLEESFEVEFHLGSNKSIKKKINVLSVTIIRQPEGAVTYNQFAFDKEHFLTVSENARDYIGVIDIGHFTTDYALFRDGVIIEDVLLYGSADAVSLVYEKLRRKLLIMFANEYGLTGFKATDQELDEAIRTGIIKYNGTEFDCTEQVQETAKEVAQKIAKEILGTWSSEASRLDAILVTGGGSHVFSKYLAEQFEQNKRQGFKVLEAPQFSNVIGFYMYGAINLVDEYGQDKVYENYVLPVFKEMM
jgi:Actin like proteins N terminal domain